MFNLSFKKLKKRRGATLIELMAAISISLIGFIGILDLQSASLQGLSDGRAMFHAMELTEHFSETLRTEAIEWTNQSTQSFNQPKFIYISNAPTPPVDGAMSDWLVATPAGYIGTMADLAPYDTGIQDEFPPGLDRRFCIHYRVSWLIANRLMRIDARVLWIRPGGELERYKACELKMAEDPTNASMIAVPIVIMMNPSVAI
jgi:hypothetical protein